MSKDKYQPSPEELAKAEGMMTDEQKIGSEARSEGFNLGQLKSEEIKKRETKERQKVDEARHERFGRVSEFMTENLSIEDFLKKFPDAKTAWFGNIGTTKSQIEKADKSHGQFDHTFIFNERDANSCLPQIEAGLRSDGWDKYYICADSSLAKFLSSQIRVSERL